MEKVTDGSQCRFATTDEFLEIAEAVSDRELGWFWEVYFRQASLPVLKAEIKNNVLFLEWKIENDLPFSVPVEVKFGNEVVKVEMREGAGSVNIPEEVEPVIREALAIRQPVVMDFVVDRDECVYPMVPAGAALTEMLLV